MRPNSVAQETIEQVLRRFRTSREWLAWILRFAQTPFHQHSPTAIEEARAVFLAFLQSPRGPGLDFSGHPLGLPSDPNVSYEMRTGLSPSVDDIGEVHRILREAIEHILTKTPCDFGRHTVHDRLTTRMGVPWIGDDYAVTAEPFPIQVRWSFARLINYLSRAWIDRERTHSQPYIRECPAPIPRQQGICGTWFVGRGDQTYCSAACQNRGSTKQSRTRQTATQPKRPRGRPRKSPSSQPTV